MATIAHLGNTKPQGPLKEVLNLLISLEHERGPII